MSSRTSPLIKTGKASIEGSSRDLFDRIINVQFIRASKRSFTVRSDYEPVFYKDNTMGFKKCTQKPDIKVAYKQVAKTTGIEVEIELRNIRLEGADSVGQRWENYSEETDADGLISVAGGDPVETCIIQMGYRAQFPDWTDENHRNNLDRYYDLNNNALAAPGSGGEAKRPQQLVVNILAGYPTSYPPDRTMYFKGIVGSFDTGLRWEHTADDLAAGFGDAGFPEGLSEIEAYLFQYVTRRFVRSGIVHQQRTAKQPVEVDGKKAYRYTQSVAVYEDGKWNAVALGEHGLMSVADAKQYGVECRCSFRLRSVAANALYGYGLTEKQAAVLRPIPPTPFDDLQETVVTQLDALQQHFPFLRWYVLNDGNYFFYHERETDEELWNDAFVKERQEHAVILPAVYDITPVGIRTIRCPFIAWVHPTDTVLFRSRFSKGTFTGYFYPVKTKAFLVFAASAAFATVEDVNEMYLSCTDIAEKDAPAVDPATGAVIPRPSGTADETPELAKLQQARYLQWTEKTLDVVLHKTGATNTDSRWANIVEKELQPSFRPENWPEGQVFTEALALGALKDWNPEYFDPDGKYMKRSDATYGRSIENDASGIGGRTGIEVPWLKAGEDKIVVRYPFQAEYPDGEQVVV
jgi:hypothetical protein